MESVIEQTLLGFPEEKIDTTAIYANRRRDKARVELQLGLAEKGNETQQFLTMKGSLFAEGYLRIVYGDHGPYVEFEPRQIRIQLLKRFGGRPLPPEAYYEWLEPSDGSGAKVYDQKRSVKHLKNPPAGGHQGNREEGYADYIPGRIYVSPFELTIFK